MDGGGTPTRQKPSLALPKMSCGPPPIVSTPPLMAGGEAPAPGPSSRSSTDSNRPSLSIGSVGTTGSSTSSGLSVAQSRYPTTITHYDQDEEGGGKIANPDQIVGDIQKAIGATTLEDDLGSNQELPERPDVGRGRSSSSVIRPMIVRRPNTGDSGKSHRGSLEQSRGDGAPARQATSPPPRLDPSAELDEEPEEEVEIDPADLQVLRSLGEGAGGEVMKVLHKPTGLVMAKKVRSRAFCLDPAHAVCRPFRRRPTRRSIGRFFENSLSIAQLRTATARILSSTMARGSRRCVSCSRPRPKVDARRRRTPKSRS